MTQSPQEISITYGTFTIDNTNKANYLILDNSWGVAYRDTSATVSFKVLVMGSDEDDFYTKEEAFREAYRDIRDLLTITLSGEVYHSWTVSGGGTHADSVPKVELLNDDYFTRRSAAFSVSVDVVMPAITTRRSENVVISKDASSIRTMTITATYNATSSTGAYQSYQADFDTFCLSVISFIDAREGAATWEHVNNPNLTTNTVVNNVVTITRVYKELIFNQSDEGLDDDELVDMTFTIDFSISQLGDTISNQVPDSILLKRTTQRPADILVNVRANVPKSVTDLEEVFTNKMRPYLVEHARVRGGFAVLAVSQPKVNYDRVNNIINATFNMVGAKEGVGQILSSTVSINIKNEFGNLLVGAHDGTPYGRYVVPVKATRTKTITEMILAISSGSVGGSGGSGGGGSISVGVGIGGGGGLFGGGNPFGGGVGFYTQENVPRLSFGPGDPEVVIGSLGGVGIGLEGNGYGVAGSEDSQQTESGGAVGGASPVPPPKDGWVLMSDESNVTPKVIGTVTVANENFAVTDVTYSHTYAWVTTPIQGGNPNRSVTTSSS